MTFYDKLTRAFPFLLLSAYGLFMCGYFFLQDYNDHYRVFARFVFLPGLLVLAAGIKANWRHPLFQAVVAYMLYLLLSGLWSEPQDWYRLGQKLTISIYLLSFITITHFLVRWNRQYYERMLLGCILVAAVAAVTSIVIFYSDNPFPTARLAGLGSLTNVNEFSVVYGVFALLAMGFALRSQELAPKLLLLSAIGVFIAFAWFGQSRATLVALMIALFCLVGLGLRGRRLLYWGILATWLATLLLVFPDSVDGALHRGMGLRPQIWAQVWAEAKFAPLAGHGLISPLSIAAGDRVFANAHNAYLQVFWQGGAMGLGLFLLLLLLAFRHAWALGRQRGDYTVFCLLVFAACVMLTDLDTLIGRPRDQWMLFWLPVALLLSYPATQSPSDSR